MLKVPVLISMLATILHPGVVRQELTVQQRAEIADRIVEWRQLFVGDNIRWNWCHSGDVFWSDNGEFIGKGQRSIAVNEVRHRSDCPKELAYKPMSSVVTVGRVLVKGDSIIVRTAVDKPDTIIMEEYRLLRDAFGSITVREYRIVGAITRHS